MNPPKTLCTVQNLTKWFPVKGARIFGEKPFLKAVDGVDFQVQTRETLGLVGESGCGKTTVGRTLMRIHDPTAGVFLYYPEDAQKHPVDIFSLKAQPLRKVKRQIQMVFQDPYASLNPRMTVQDIISEGIRANRMVRSKKGIIDHVADIMEKVGLRPEYMKRYPHEFSGGQRQRIGIARVMIMRPRLVICDEPVSALDVSVQAQIINLLEDLKEAFDLTYLFIAHDLSVVKHISDRIAVMYLGKIVETADTETLFSRPLHPYTVGLLSAIPVPDPRFRKKEQRALLTGDIPSPINPPDGCRFAKRCPYVMDRCNRENPSWVERESGHFVSCFLHQSD